MKKNNKQKGFTFIELLVVIGIITIITGLASYTILNLINSSKEKSIAITNKNIKEAAKNYTQETENIVWNVPQGNTNHQITCITINDLINDGYLNEKLLKEKHINNINHIIIEKNIETQVITSEYFDTNNTCSNNYTYVTIPDCNNNLIYNGTNQKLINDTSTLYNINSSENNQTNAGTYNIKISLIDTKKYAWKNGSLEPITKKCTIKKAPTNITLIPTSMLNNTSNKYNFTAIPEIIDKNIKPNNQKGKLTVINSNKEYIKIKNISNETPNFNEEVKIDLTAQSEREKITEIKITFAPNNQNLKSSNAIFKLSSKEITKTHTVELIVNEKEETLGYPSTFEIIHGEKYGNNLVLPETHNGYPQKKGHTFEYWYEEIDKAPKKITDIVTKPHKLYAKWKPQEYTIKFHPNGGTGTIENKITKFNEKIPTIPDINQTSITNKGHTFIGWTTNSDGTNDGINWINKTGNWTFINGDYGIINNTLTLYAMWKPQEYTIKFNANDGNGSINDITTKYNQTTTIPGTTQTNITRKGYTFLGWTTNSDGTDDKYNWTGWNGTWTYINGEYGIQNNKLTLYARWKPIEYTINFNANDGNGSINDITIKYNQTTTIPGTTQTNITRNGYTFLGWTTNSDGTDDKYNWTGWNGNWTYINGEYGIQNNKLTLYAMWKPQEYTIKFNANGGSGTISPITIKYNEQTSIPNTAQTLIYKTDNTFLGWTTNSNNTDDNYGWTGWNGNWSFVNGEYGIQNNTLTLYARWKPNSNTVTLNNQGATTSGSTSVTATYGYAMPDITVPQKKYTVTYNYNGNGQNNTTATATYTFGGYYTSTNGTGTQYYKSDGKSAKNWDKTTDTTLYAKWTSQSITLPTPTRSGYTFTGWYTATSGGTSIGAGGKTYTPTSNITLYARWTVTPLQISYTRTASNVIKYTVSGPKLKGVCKIHTNGTTYTNANDGKWKTAYDNMYGKSSKKCYTTTSSYGRSKCTYGGGLTDDIINNSYNFTCASQYTDPYMIICANTDSGLYGCITYIISNISVGTTKTVTVTPK